MTCPQCGAAVKQGDGRFCSHCAAALPDRPRITAEEWVTHRERFEQAERDPAYTVAFEQPAPEPRLYRTIVPITAFAILWVVVGAIITTGFARQSGAMALFPVALVGVGLVGMGATIAKQVRRARAPVTRQLAVIVDERTEIDTRGSGDDRRTSTSYYATLHLRGGDRVEVETSGPLSGMITRGDLGVAVLRGAVLVDFHRIRV